MEWLYLSRPGNPGCHSYCHFSPEWLREGLHLISASSIMTNTKSRPVSMCSSGCVKLTASRECDRWYSPLFSQTICPVEKHRWMQAIEPPCECNCICTHKATLFKITYHHKAIHDYTFVRKLDSPEIKRGHVLRGKRQDVGKLQSSLFFTGLLKCS